MREQQLQSKIIKYLDSQGYYCIKVITATRSGVPDIICCSPEGKFLAVEVKAPNKKAEPSKLQKYNIDRILTNFGMAITVNNIIDLKEYLK